MKLKYPLIITAAAVVCAAVPKKSAPEPEEFYPVIEIVEETETEKASEPSVAYDTYVTDDTTVTVSETAVSMSYVLNTNTKKIHYPDCPSVEQIKEHNLDYTDDYDNAVDNVYKPCKRCKP